MAFKMKGPSILKMVKKSAMKMAKRDTETIIDPKTGKRKEIINPKPRTKPEPAPRPKPKPRKPGLRDKIDKLLIAGKKKSPTKLKLDYKSMTKAQVRDAVIKHNRKGPKTSISMAHAMRMWNKAQERKGKDLEKFSDLEKFDDDRG